MTRNNPIDWAAVLERASAFYADGLLCPDFKTHEHSDELAEFGEAGEDDEVLWLYKLGSDIDGVPDHSLTKRDLLRAVVEEGSPGTVRIGTHPDALLWRLQFLVFRPLEFPMLEEPRSETVNESVSNVRWGTPTDGEDVILFDLKGVPYRGVLSGRNEHLVLGFGEEQDRAVAVRVLADGCAHPCQPSEDLADAANDVTRKDDA